MAVPKKRKSYFKTTRKYTTNYSILFKSRKLNYLVTDLVSVLVNKNNWINTYFLKQKKVKDKLSLN